MRHLKYFILFALFLFLSISYKTYEQYHQIQNTQRLIILNESQSLSAFISAFRQTYQDIFIRHHIEINEKTINLLPVKTSAEISKHFSKNVNGDVVIRTVSDRPRNINNMANNFELNMIDYFKNNPTESDNFIEKGDNFYYTKPLLIKKNCLKCHGKREDAIKSIRERYENAYDYKLGDIRGLLNIKIKKNTYFEALYADFIITAIISVLFYILLLIVVYYLLKTLHMKEKLYTKKLEIAVSKKTHELKEQKEILHHQAHHDVLTGLPNRILFNDRLEHGIELSKRHKMKLALFFIDLDHFKEINDSLGHQMGDKVLIAVTKRLQEKIRKEDTLSRLGGDEFTIIVEDLNNTQDVSLLAQKILQILTQPIYIDGHTLYVSCSIGISLYPQDNTNYHNLIKYADAAMYKAKDEGRNNFQFYSSEMTALAFERVRMETGLRQALNNDEFILYYQPQIDANNEKLVGMEALIRWQHPTMGLITPDKFISLAEETGLIVEIDRWVMKTAMRQISKWYKEGYNPGVLALNLSLRELKNNNFIDILNECFDINNFKPEWLELEITESQMMEDPEKAILKLNKISSMGIELAVDDFGTGYSSLAYLKRLPLNKIKIDQSFVSDIPNNREDTSIIKAIIALANSLNLKLIAEGVETYAQKEFLRKNGCHNIQGFYYSKPIPADKIKERYLTNAN